MRRTSHRTAPARVTRARLAVSSAALALVGLTGLTACSEAEPEPKFAEEPSATPTQEREETAEEFIRRWNDEQREMQKGDTTEYRKIAGDCEPCMATADTVDEYYSAGGYVATEGRTIVWLRKVRKAANGTIYQVRVNSAPTEYTTAKGAPVQKFDGGRVTYELLLTKKGGRWALTDVWEIPS